MKKSMEILQKSKNKIILWSSNPTCGYMFKMKSLSQRDIYTHLSTEVLFTITNMETAHVFR